MQRTHLAIIIDHNRRPSVILLVSYLPLPSFPTFPTSRSSAQVGRQLGQHAALLDITNRQLTRPLK